MFMCTFASAVVGAVGCSAVRNTLHSARSVPHYHLSAVVCEVQVARRRGRNAERYTSQVSDIYKRRK